MKPMQKKVMKYLALLVVSAMMMGLLPMGALASTIPSSGITATYDLSSNSVTINDSGTYVINQSGSGTTSNTITISGNATVYLNGVNILVPRPSSNTDLSKPNPININSGYTVNLHLVDGTTNTLASQEGIVNTGGTRVGSSKAGLRVPSRATLNIYGYSGILNTTGAQGYNFSDGYAHGGGGAGIGGNGGYCDATKGYIYIDAEASGTVRIFGGFINAFGGPAAGHWGNGGSGIGGGGASYLGYDGNSGNVSISGGFVTVVGGNPSVRPSGYGVGGHLTITGGKLKAISANTSTDSKIRPPLASQPSLASDYQWRTVSTDSFTWFPEAAYGYSINQRYVEIHVSYYVDYALNGGSVATANPVEYTSGSDSFTLYNPTRTGYSFVGWSGTDLEGNTNQNVTITKGSTGERSYTANWKADAPSMAPVASIVTAKTSSTITIATQDGYEYSVDGTSWYSGTGGSYTFTGLAAGTSYNLVYRVAAINTGDLSAASDPSPSMSVWTKYAPALSLSVTPESATYPDNIGVVATLTGADSLAGKLIKFYDGEEYLLSVSTDGNGKATFIERNPIPKLYNFRAEFGGDDYNMAASSADLTYTVLKATQAAVLFANTNDIQKTYGDSSFALPAVSGGSGSGAYSYRSSNEEVATVSGNTVTITGAGEATIYVKRLGDNYYNDSNEVFILVKVDKKDISIAGMAAANKEYDGNTVANIDDAGAMLVGVENEDVVTIDDTNASAAFADANAGTGKTVTFKKFALSGVDADNYRLASQPANTTANITPRQVTVSGITASDKAYDGNTTATLIYSAASFARLLADDSLSITATGTFTSKNVQSDAIQINLSAFVLGGTSVANYELSPTGQQTTTFAKITPATLTVTPESGQYKYYGQADPTLTPSASGAVAGETPGYSGALSRTPGEMIANDYAIGVGSLALITNGTFLVQNYQLIFSAIPVNFEIKSYSTTAVAAATPNGDNGWFKTAPITLTAPAGYLISTSNAFKDNTWTNSITLDDADGDLKSTTYYLRNIETDPDTYKNAISTSKVFDYKADKTAPSITTSEITYDVINDGILAQIGNFLTFGNFFKEGIKITVPATDATSGLDKLYYTCIDADGEDYVNFINSDVFMKKIDENLYDGDAIITIVFDDVKNYQNMTIEVYATDKAGNASEPDSLQGTNGSDKWTFENINPVIGSFKVSGNDITAEQWYNTSSVSVTSEITDDVGIFKVQYKVDGAAHYTTITPGLNDNGVNPAIYDYSKIVLGEGSHTLELLVTDNAMNESSKSIAFRIDSIAPVIASVTGNAASWQNTDVTLTVNASDNGSGLAATAYSFDGGATWQAENTKVYSVNQTIAANTIQVRDVAGNVEKYSTEIIISRIDKTNPVDPAIKLNDSAPSTDWYTAYPTIAIIPATHVEGTAPETTYYKLWNTSAEDTEPADGVELTTQPTITADGIWQLKTWTIDAAGNTSTPAAIEIKVDTTAPDGDIKIEENSVKKFLNDITFGLFFNQNVDVTVTAADAGSGVAKIEYYKSSEILDQQEVEGLDLWTQYTDTITETAVDATRFIYYIKITDEAGNVTYFASNGATFDTTDPAITGITNGAVYYVDQIVTVTDTNLDTITLNNDPFASGDKITGNMAATYVVDAIDKAGNSTTLTVAMKPIASLSTDIDLLDVDNVKPDDRAVIETVAANVEAVLLTTSNGASQAQIDELNAILDQCNDLLETLDQVAELEKLITALPKPGEVTKADADAIAKARDAYESLTDHQNGLVDADLKTKLAEVISALRKVLLFDASTGTRIEAVDGTVLDLRTGLVVTSVMNTLDAATMQKFNLGVSSVANGQEIIQLYDIKLMLDGQVIQPGGKVKVTLTLTDEQASYTNLKIAYIADDGTAVIIPSTINGNEISFIIDHFSYYAIIGTPIPVATPITKTGETRPFFPLIGLALLSAALLITNKKRRKMRADKQ